MLINIIFFSFSTTMNHIGRAKSSTQPGSIQYMFCHLCQNVRAASHCLDCRIYLCESCADHHTKYPTFDNHRLLDIRYANIAVDTCIRRCSDHPQEDIKFFCAVHDAVYCCICRTTKHNGCQQKYIPELCKDYIKSGDYKKLTAYFQSTDANTIIVLKEIDNCIKKVNQLNCSQVEKLKTFKLLIIAYLDQREKELLYEIQLTHDKDIATLKKLQSCASSTKSDLSKELANVKTHEKNSSDLFIATKRAQALLDKLRSSLDVITSKTKYQEYDFQRDPLVESLLKNKDGMAQLVTLPGIMK